MLAVTLVERVKSRNIGATKRKESAGGADIGAYGQAMGRWLHAMTMAGFIIASALTVAAVAVMAPLCLLGYAIVGLFSGERKSNGWRPANA